MITFEDIFKKEMIQLAYAMGMKLDDMNVIYLVSANMEEFALVTDEDLLIGTVVEEWDNGIVIYEVATERVLHIEPAY